MDLWNPDLPTAWTVCAPIGGRRAGEGCGAAVSWCFTIFGRLMVNGLLLPASEHIIDSDI